MSQKSIIKFIDQEITTHLWIIFGNHMENIVKWPALQVTDSSLKLHCPHEDWPKLSVQPCRKEPVRKFTEMSILSTVPVQPYIWRQNGELYGIHVTLLKDLGEYIQYKPKYIMKYGTFNKLIEDLNQGKGEIGVPTHVTIERYKLIDFTSMESISQLMYLVPTPKPVDVLYQFISPFQRNVWLSLLVFIGIFWILTFLSVQLLKSKPDNYSNDKFMNALKLVKSKNILDYLIASSGALIAPTIMNLGWMRALWINTKGGGLILIVLAIHGFLASNIYKITLLSYLTAVEYENEIESVSGKYRVGK